MPRLAIPLLLVAAAAALAACAHSGGAASGVPPDGAALYRRSCSSCHRLKQPAEHDAATWRRAVERFGARLPPEERAAITAWLEGSAAR